MIYDQLYPWQKAIVNKFASRQSLGLFLDMGLGKTPLSLAFAERHSSNKLIIVTLNNKANEAQEIAGSWRAWIVKMGKGYSVYTKADAATEGYNDNAILIINYEAIFARGRNIKKRVQLSASVQNFIHSCRKQNVTFIIDESHKMKNLSSLQTCAIMEIKKQLLNIAADSHIYLLTGTPFTVGYIDLYSQLKMLGCSETKSQFIEQYCIRANIPGLLGWQQPIVSYKNLDDLFKLVHQFAITMKSDDVIELPQQVFVDHYLPQSNIFDLLTQEKMSGITIEKEMSKRKLMTNEKYSTAHKVNNPFFRNIAFPDTRWLAETNGTFWLRARQLAIGFQGNAEMSMWYDRTRLDELETFLKANEDNYILFYNFTPELLELYDICTRLSYNVDVFCGEIKSTAMYEHFCSLSEAEKLVTKKNIILANYASGAAGMNWQEYNKCILFSLPLYKDYEQSLKRVHRIGQTHTVVYHQFYQNNWLDLGMKRALEQAKEYSLKMFENDVIVNNCN